MIKIAIVGDIGSGKSYVAKNFGYPVFNADIEVSKLYKNDKIIFNKIKKNLFKYIKSFPINKNHLSKAIIANSANLQKIIKIIHPEIRRKMNIFIKKHSKKKIVVLDIPLFLENKIDEKDDILIFVESKKSEIYKRLKKRKNFNLRLFKKFKKIQLTPIYKKKKSHFIIKNDFTTKTIKIRIKDILQDILPNE
jgi:dephospho-CoA kinase